MNLLLSNKNIKYFLKDYLFYRRDNDLPTMDFTNTIHPFLLQNTRNVQKCMIRYDGTMFPLLELQKIDKDSERKEFNLYFTIKPHSRCLVPYGNILKFKIPETHMFCFNVLKSASVRIAVNEIEFSKYTFARLSIDNYFSKLIKKTLCAWPCGNVNSSGAPCWGSQDIPSLTLFAEQLNVQEGELYLDTYMQLLYSSFFNSGFNKDYSRVYIERIIDCDDPQTAERLINTIKTNSDFVMLRRTLPKDNQIAYLKNLITEVEANILKMLVVQSI